MALASVSVLTAAAILIPGFIVAKSQDGGTNARQQEQALIPGPEATGVELPGGSAAARQAGQADANEAAGGAAGAADGGQASGTAVEAAGGAGGPADGGQPTGVAPGGGAPAGTQGSAPRPSTGPKKLTALDLTQVRVYVTKEKRIEKVPMETYIRGVIAGEMPISFEPEALKAQAIAARTYIVRRLASGDVSGMPVKGADVTDTTAHQVYIPMKQLLARWSGKEREANLTKLNEAVQGTRGEIVTYQGSPIQALFFSTSNGYTENSEDYWDASLPYLRSVASPWDKSLSPEYKETTTMPLASFYQKLGLSGSTPARSLRVLDTTDGRRIRELAAGDATFTGREAREKLGLASSQFTWKISGKNIEITTYGYGHGVGMSQWGADGMAKKGSTAYQILSHYYTGTAVVRENDLPRMSS
ncbi:MULTISPECIES: stage II sporulation protein D [unclassified Paenibacillus]|uniref:stage II sporulation protein D n=1 Tax=unclassified Paenibacillus TaxID=185978 RepID=UPI0009F91C29|nr:MULTISPECIES: stage II sporulation protein D [unclassified Paenibacillus]